jgi:hypothetical protein
MTPRNAGIAGIAGISRELPTLTCAHPHASREGLEHTRNTHIFGGIPAFLGARCSIFGRRPVKCVTCVTRLRRARGTPLFL